MNRIAVVSMMKNEADIVESSIRHWAKFADKIFVCDHKSTDRTHEILDLLKEEGLNLEISTYTRDETDQKGIMNKLLQKSLDDGFDIILPLDCDEFPIFINGNSNDLRKHFQTLDTNHCYRTYCWDHRFADEDESKFAFSRSIVRAKSFNPNLPKIIIGREPVVKYHGELVTGQHHLYFKNKAPNYSVLNDQQIFYVHLNYRSSAQATSKRILWYLGTRMQVTRYNCWGENSTSQQMADHYFGDTPPKLDLNGFEPTDLSEYKDECINKFSGGGGVNPCHALFLLTTSYADTLSRERILSRQEIVRIFLLFDGDVERSIKSLESCFNQTYEFKKIFVVLMNRKNIGDLIIALKDRSDQIEFVDQSEIQNKLKSPDGIYVQFVTAGNRLNPEKILHCVEFMHIESNPQISICQICQIDVDLKFDKICGKDLLSNYKKDLSRFFFHQSIFEENLQIDITSLNFIANKTIYVLNESLVEN